MAKAKDHQLQLSENKPFSLLQANEYFMNKILSRNSSFGQSIRLSTYSPAGQIPFKWEAQPGKPKDEISGDAIGLAPPEPPIEELSKPYVISNKLPPESVRVWFWKKSKKKKKNKNNVKKTVSMENEAGELSYSFCSSSSKGYARRQSKFRSLVKEFIRWAF